MCYQRAAEVVGLVPSASGCTAGDDAEPSVATLAWDAQEERLAVALKGGQAGKGSVAVFATSYKPIMSIRLLGTAADPPPESSGALLFWTQLPLSMSTRD